MSEVRLIVRELERDWSGNAPASLVDRAVAALSADPMTLMELDAALGRYEKPHPHGQFFWSLSPGLDDEPYDAGLVVIDLAARVVMMDSTYSSPSQVGEVSYHDGHCATDTWLRYHLDDDWLLIGDQFLWQAPVSQRRRERAAQPPLDARRVLYGPPLLEFVAREAFAAYARRETIADVNDAIKEIHAAWLLTPRDDLRGASPRDVALERRSHISRDVQNQSERWSLLQECPPGLPESSFAFRYGGFGTHELVKYYDLVRELLWACWDRLVEWERTWPRLEGLTAGDFLAGEIPRLERLREIWFDAPDPECGGRTPRSIIDRERSRLPEGMSGHEAVIDPDCPCCQMMADMPGPVFWFLDGSNMDDDFAFAIHHRTREEWEAEQREWEEHRRRFDAEQQERERLGVTYQEKQAENSAWSSSFFVDDAADIPLGVRLFGIGARLAELVVDLRAGADHPSATPAAQSFIDQLNRDFGNLRELLQTSEPSLAAALLEPTINRFTDTLSAVDSARPDLSAKCDSLTENLARFLDPALSADDRGESDVPF